MKQCEINTRQISKFVHEGDYVAEVKVEYIYTDEEWSPYISLQDARKLDAVRDALRRADIASASQLAQIYKLTPVAT
jgi:hypothetical protein